MLTPSLEVQEMVDLGCQLARAAGKRQGQERERFLKLAMNVLRRAKENGFRNVERLQDKNLEILRCRPEFQKLIAEMTGT